MNCRIACWLAACLLVSAVSGLADGGFIAPTAFAKVQIPDQRALIRFANGTETLVIDTSFKGEGTNFAWIVPVPSVPAVEAATRGLFPTLGNIFQPKVVHNVLKFYWVAIGVAVFLMSIIERMIRGKSVVGILLLWLLLLILSSFLLPALGTAGVSSASSAAGVRVLERKMVGAYDTVTLSSKDGSAVVDWLSKNGFATPTNFLPAIRTYAAEGWFFVASKVHLENSLTEAAKMHPLIFTFKTERAVYPLRLTGIGNERCQVELFVFGSNRAEVPNFEVEYCAKPSYPDQKEDYFYRSLNDLRIRHPLLRRLVEGSPVATKLTGRLTSEQMKEDAYVSWTPFEQKRLTFYSRHGARIFASNVAVTGFVFAVLAVFSMMGSERIWVRKVRAGSVIVGLVSVASWFPIYVALPKTEVVTSRMPSLMMRSIHGHQVPSLLSALLVDEKGGKISPDITWIRQQISTNLLFGEVIGRRAHTNLFSGQILREEDSPGNYAIRENAGLFDYIWYDIDGGEHVVPLFRKEE